MTESDLLRARPATPGAPSIVVVGSGARTIVAAALEGVASVSLAPTAAATAHVIADLFVVDLPPADAADALRLLARRAVPAPAIAVAEDARDAGELIAAGAHDVVFAADPVEVVRARALAAVQMQSLRRRLADTSAVLEDQLREQAKSILKHLNIAGEYRDDDTREHTRRVGATSALVAERIGRTREFVETMRDAAPLHDIGKIGVMDAVLLKRAALTEEEFEHVKKHAIVGGRILWGARHPLVRAAHEIAMFHHERWDGGGYPAGLAREDIPLSARIAAVADVFDALTHERPYKPAWAIDEALAELQKVSGSHLDGMLVDAFVDVVRDGGLERIGWT